MRPMPSRSEPGGYWRPSALTKELHAYRATERTCLLQSASISWSPLAQSRTLLPEQAHLIKDYRNLGGHDTDIEVGPRDVPLIREFVESLLDNIYWAPDKLDRVMKEFGLRLTRERG